MAGVNFSFDLGPVSGPSVQPTRGQTSGAENAAAGAHFQSVQKSVQASSVSAHPVADSPACDGSGCFIVHGDGPGVTTLSIGEEDGGASSYVALPVVDGSQFLEPPVQSFASAGDYEITTLAIGEEDGGIASASPSIGADSSTASQSSGGILDYVEQTTLEAYAPHEPAFADGLQTASVSETYGVMEPVYSAGDTNWGAEPLTFVEAEAGPAATTSAVELEAIQTEAISASPIPKPATVASAGSPLPDLKPTAIPSGVSTASTTMEPTANAPAASGSFVSVGDYDSYIASTSGAAGVPQPDATVLDEPIAAQTSDGVAEPEEALGTASIDAEQADPIASSASTTAMPQPAYVIQESAPSQNADSETVSSSISPDPAPISEPAYVIEETADQSSPALGTDSTPTTAAALEPAYVIQESSVDSGASSVAPRMKPATATTPEPVYTINAPSEGGVIDLTHGTTYSTIEAPVPLEKPADASADVPKLSEEDYRITTLALGEEEAGGG